MVLIKKDHVHFHKFQSTPTDSTRGFSRPFRFASGLVVLQKKREHYTFRAGCAVLDTSQSSDCLYPCVTLDLRPRMKFVASVHSSGHLLLLLDPAMQMCHLRIVSNFLLANLKCGTSCNSVTWAKVSRYALWLSQLLSLWLKDLHD